MRLSVAGTALIIALLAPTGSLVAQHHGHGHFAVGFSQFGYLPPLAYGNRFAFAPAYGYPVYGYAVNGVGLVYWPPAIPLAQPIVGPQPNPNMPPGVVGVAPPAAGQPQLAQPPAIQPQAANQPPERRAERKPRVSNVEAKARAGKFIDAGDRLFRQQRFREALERYKLAGPQAPDMAEIYMRQGFAESAIGQYETAGRLLRRGLKVQANWRPGELRLDDLYGGDNRLAKGAHFEAIAQAVQAAPHDPNLYFVLALELEFDGQSERAAPFFLRANQLGANEDHSLDSFLPAAEANAAGGANAGGPIRGGVDPAAKEPIVDM